MDRLAGFQTLATCPLIFLAVRILRVSFLVLLLFTAPVTLMSSGDAAILIIAGKSDGAASKRSGPGNHDLDHRVL
jgi:hypothetical protein